MMKSKKRKRSGFTLAEVVAVIVILGLLSGVITPQIVKTIKKGRDVRRISDIDSLASALQAYYLDNAAYPTAAAWTYSTGAFLGDLTTGNYITQTIEDPKNDATYKYAYKRDATGAIPFAVIGCKTFEQLSTMGGTVSSETLYYYKQLYER
ncbi:MAG: prepilin-type N-terminal cleavage/methylation domain-containing protein [Candidatus Kaelpia aquatica]|nr:prepilin-type N-terminal cleavage/methylation domain-containing protein [Candidatus Kaelpia aquatica]